MPRESVLAHQIYDGHDNTVVLDSIADFFHCGMVAYGYGDNTSGGLPGGYLGEV